MDRVQRFRDRARPAAGFAVVVALVIAVVAALTPSGSQQAADGRTREFWIAADEVAWDYAPAGNLIDPLFDEFAAVFLEGGRDRIGSTYLKALYREYEPPESCPPDFQAFTCLKPVAAEWQHLGTLGPLIRAEVGDTIVVHFKNNTRFHFSVHPHGVFYEKDSEGAVYNDPDDDGGDAVPPGESWTYTWPVPARAGPGPSDPSSIIWMYHSHVDESGDTNAGLVGPIIIGRRGAMKDDGTPRDVDREFVTMFTVFDENRSPYLDHNIQAYAGQPNRVDPDDEGFIESNLMHSINGFVFGNLPGLDMKVGEQVRWYLIGMGTEVDLHTPHWHGQTVDFGGMRTDVIELLPASMKTVNMEPDNPGVWLYHCHVNDHIDAGMMALFTVMP